MNCSVIKPSSGIVRSSRKCPVSRYSVIRIYPSLQGQSDGIYLLQAVPICHLSYYDHEGGFGKRSPWGYFLGRFFLLSEGGLFCRSKHARGMVCGISWIRLY